MPADVERLAITGMFVPATNYMPSLRSPAATLIFA